MRDCSISNAFAMEISESCIVHEKFCRSPDNMSGDFEQTSDILKQGKSEGFDSCDRPSNLTQIGFKSSIF